MSHSTERMTHSLAGPRAGVSQQVASTGSRLQGGSRRPVSPRLRNLQDGRWLTDDGDCHRQPDRHTTVAAIDHQMSDAEQQLANATPINDAATGEKILVGQSHAIPYSEKLRSSCLPKFALTA